MSSCLMLAVAYIWQVINSTIMTARAKSGRIEVEIEKNREEGNWLKVIELAQQLKDKSNEFVCLSDFLIGEGKLENFLEEWPPMEQNIQRARSGLIDAKRYLNLVITNAGIKAGVAMDAHLLLGKVHYACGQYADALKNYKMADLQNLTEKRLPLRSLKIVAESYAIKGLCLQKDTSASSKFKKAEKEEELARCFDLASDLSLLYMQNLDKELNSLPNTGSINTGSHSPQPPSHQKTLGAVLEQAIQAAPLALLQQGKPEESLERYRNTLCAIESPGVHNIRLKFMTQIAELLLQGLVGDKYQLPSTVSVKSSYWKPKCYSSLNQFIPKCDCEEVILVLLVAESMAVRHAVLSQSPEFKDIRLSAGQDATTVYDLLTVATVRWGQVALLQESLERSMKFSFEDPHLWKHHCTLPRFFSCITRSDTNCLLAAKLCYEHMNLAEEGKLNNINRGYLGVSFPMIDCCFKGIDFSLQARERELNNPSGLLGRCHLYAGIGYYLRAEASLLKKEQDYLRCKAIDNIRSQTISDMPECDRKSDTRSVFQLYTSEMSDKDSSSLQLHNTAATRVEQALSEVASSMSSFSPRPGPQRAWMLQVEVWLLLAELYLSLDQISDVQQCIQEATHIYPLSHHIMHMKGLLHMHKEEWTDAKVWFQNAVAINPLHVKSLQQLGLVYHYLGLQGLAETTLREAARIEPHNTITWYNLGKVLEALGAYEKASNAIATALMEERNNPVLPFNSVPLCFE
ncbi:hypothetical protein YQE_02266, partial [Dendroctonus ponderosae]